MKPKMFYIANVQANINLGNLSHIYRNGNSWTVVTASGSEYNIDDEEYNRLMETLNAEPEKKEEDKDYDLRHIAEIMGKLRESGISFDFKKSE